MLNRNNRSMRCQGAARRAITLLLWGMLLAGCPGAWGGAGEKPEPAGAEIALYDSVTFDIKLSSSLATRLPVVTVPVIAPFTVNDIPERIDKWLDSVRRTGGTVTLKPDPAFPASRNFGLITDLLSKVYDLAKEMLIYRHAEHYDVDVLYQPGSGTVTRFVFRRQEGVEQ